MRLRDGSWRIDFSGKEFLRVIGSRIFNRAIAPRANQPSPAEFDTDLAKSIAAWQIANGAVPTDLSDLLAALKARISPSPRLHSLTGPSRSGDVSPFPSPGPPRRQLPIRFENLKVMDSRPLGVLVGPDDLLVGRDLGQLDGVASGPVAGDHGVAVG